MDSSFDPATAVGMYVKPQWTLPRVAGALLEQAWLRLSPASHNSSMVRCGNQDPLYWGASCCVS